jgi:hypothetical protein
LLVFVRLTARLQNGLQLVQGEHWEKPSEAQEQRQEDADGANENADVDACGVELTPA